MITDQNGQVHADDSEYNFLSSLGNRLLYLEEEVGKMKVKTAGVEVRGAEYDHVLGNYQKDLSATRAELSFWKNKATSLDSVKTMAVSQCEKMRQEIVGYKGEIAQLKKEVAEFSSLVTSGKDKKK